MLSLLIFLGYFVIAHGFRNVFPSGALFIDIPIDHFGNEVKVTYENRYWVNDTYYEPGGPVFLFDAGEQDAEPLLAYYLQEHHGLSATMRLAQRHRGLAILWEHRYYGSSLPFSLNENTTAEQWKLLTTEQALEDVVFFANSFAAGDEQLRALHPSQVPWIWLGASYPGTRGAMLRLRNPEVIFAVWASSAPPQAQINMPSYFQASEKTLTRNCSADWSAITKYTDKVLHGTNETLKTDFKFALKRALLTKPGGNTSQALEFRREDAAKMSEREAALILQTPLFHFQYYGFHASILPFCDLLETKNFTAPPHDSGIVHSEGVASGFDAFVTALAESDIEVSKGLPFPKSWMWQYCSEYGFFLTGDPKDPRSIATSYRSVGWYQETCHASFPEEALPPVPNVENVLKYGGWHMNPTNVFFTNGEFDPWRTLSLASIEWDAPFRTPTTDIPVCNVAPPNKSFFGMTHKNMVHSPDMRVLLTPDSNHTNFRTIGYHSPISAAPFYTALDLFQRALDKWLPCFIPTKPLVNSSFYQTPFVHQAPMDIFQAGCPNAGMEH